MNINTVRPQTMNTVVQQHSGTTPQLREVSQKPESTQQVQSRSEDSLLNNDERKFFEELFPHAQNEVRAYHAYRRDGTRVAFTTGTLIDRKG